MHNDTLFINTPEQASAATREYIARINKALEEIDTCVREMYPSKYKDKARNDGLEYFTIMLQHHVNSESQV